MTRIHSDDSEAEKIAAIRTIRKLMDFWRISPKELRGTTPLQAVSKPHSILYKHPVSGEHWDGKGKQPEWLRLALTKEGYTVEEIRWKEPEPFKVDIHQQDKR
ncbi:DNA-binding protein H-NS [Leptothrix ochracea L12]|uniref:DNA-binding protein H-NS n=1 Tax=Leptothrix ochracea L12 TaxID=735332 RepID=I4Z662_9BURK|nr:H-NS family nucleoid-associated regulatory protein [Leptothrix ochracea]EIM31704.1 DNA-binding protein H-NS [Leptothrix ochracea L12]